MKANSTYISLETAKLLKGCGVEGDYYYIELFDENLESRYILNHERIGDRATKEQYPAYTWQEIEENAEKFFGNEVKNFSSSEFIWGHWELYVYHSVQLLLFRLQKRYDEADLYLRKNCILIKK